MALEIRITDEDTMVDLKVAKERLGEEWFGWLQDELQLEYMSDLKAFLLEERKEFDVYPPIDQIFRALKLTPPSKIKVVILGQDPYHGVGQAHGLSFSVPKGVRPPPSLQNIFKEIQSDIGLPPNAHQSGNKENLTIIQKVIDFDLTFWADQGVLLLNSILSVRKNSPGSHRERGWERFTDKIIQTINEKLAGIVFLLWGSFAKKKIEYIDSQKHLVLTSSHPSPFSVDRGFFGCKHFSKTNSYLTDAGKEKIKWI